MRVASLGCDIFFKAGCRCLFSFSFFYVFYIYYHFLLFFILFQDGEFDTAAVPVEGELSFPSQLSEGANSLPTQNNSTTTTNSSMIDSAIEVTEGRLSLNIFYSKEADWAG